MEDGSSVTLGVIVIAVTLAIIIFAIRGLYQALKKITKGEATAKTYVSALLLGYFMVFIFNCARGEWLYNDWQTEKYLHVKAEITRIVSKKHPLYPSAMVNSYSTVAAHCLVYDVISKQIEETDIVLQKTTFGLFDPEVKYRGATKEETQRCIHQANMAADVSGAGAVIGGLLGK